MYVLSELWWKDKFSKFHAKKIIAVIDNNIVLIVVLVLKGCRTTKFKTLGNKVNCFYCRDCCFLGKLWKHKISKLHAKKLIVVIVLKCCGNTKSHNFMQKNVVIVLIVIVVLKGCGTTSRLV